MATVKSSSAIRHFRRLASIASRSSSSSSRLYACDECVARSNPGGRARSAAATSATGQKQTIRYSSSSSSLLSHSYSSSAVSIAKPSSRSAAPCQYKSVRQTPFLQAFKRSDRHASTLAADKVRPNESRSEESYAGSSAKDSDHSSASRFPQTSRRVVGWWLFGSAASVFGIVVFGGLTRLTESGLSITEWRPVTGTLPPRSIEAWTAEYDKYRASPEFQLLNPNMTLDEFKQIYFMEYTHRLWGRVIGLTTLVPTLYFIARRRVSLPMARNLLLLNGLIGLQGFVGWWMVQSGLHDDLFAQGSHPRVSQYRLATHLGLAFSVYVGMLWNGIQVFREDRLVQRQPAADSLATLNRLASRQLRPLRLSVLFLCGLISLTALSGAFVAGLDAGLIYNEFPYMGLGLAPPRRELLDPFYSRQPPPHPDLLWRNMLENPSLVQLDHRVLAVSTFTAVHAIWLAARFRPTVRAALPPPARTALSLALALVWLQATLGVTTLLYLVPIPLAAAHQAGSLALLSSAVVLASRLCTPPRLRRLVAARAAALSRQAGLRAPPQRP